MKTTIHPKALLRTVSEEQYNALMADDEQYQAKANFVTPQSSEGAWILPIGDEAVARIQDANSYDQKFEAVLANDLVFMPLVSGLVLPFRTKGENRPVLDIAAMIGELGNNGLPVEVLANLKHHLLP